MSQVERGGRHGPASAADHPLRAEDQLLCLCARQRFSHSHARRVAELCRTRAIDWEYVRFLASDHNLAPAAYAHLQPLQREIGLPEPILLRLRTVYLHNVVRKKRSRLALAVVLDWLAQNSLEAMLAKGAAYNLAVYEHDWLTERADIDLLVHRRREELPLSLLRSLNKLVEGLNSRRSEYDETIELDFYEHHDVSMNGLVVMDYERVWRDAVRHSGPGWGVLLMAPDDMLIVAAINACRKRFFRLRNLMDIAEIVEAHPDLGWSAVVDKAAHYEASSFVYTALRVAQETVGCSLPAGVLDRLAVGKVHRALIEAVLATLLGRFDLRALNRLTKRGVMGRRWSPSMLLKGVSFSARHVVPWARYVVHNRNGFEPDPPEKDAAASAGAPAATRGTTDGSDRPQSERPARRP